MRYFTKREHRHGDIRLSRIKALPKDVNKLKHKTLAYGEVTGHSHRFADDRFIDRYSDGERTFLKVTRPSTLIHEEHGPQVILPGLYEQIQEREHDYIEESARAVVD